MGANITALWKARAIAAWEREAERQAGLTAQREEVVDAMNAAILQEKLAALGVDAQPTGSTVRVDDVLFVLTAEHELGVMACCALCGENPALSPPITRLEELGWVLRRWVPECESCEAGIIDEGEAVTAWEGAVARAVVRYVRQLVEQRPA